MIKIPFAGFKDFEDCVQKQIAKGHSKNSADKICGSIKAKTENMEYKRDSQGRLIIAENVPIIFNSTINIFDENEAG